jgi:transposase-like protein
MPQAVTIRSLPFAFEVVKGMQAEGLEWGESYRPLGRDALAGILQDQMSGSIDGHLDRMAARGEADRRNGSYPRHLLTELGDIELSVPRTRRYAPIEVVRAYARRPEQVDHMILSCFVLGLSVRKVSEALLPILGRPISPATVSSVAKQLDALVAAFHARPLRDRYSVLMLDGVVLARRTGAGAIRRPVLVALGLRADGKKEVIDGGSGLRAALPIALPGVPVQRCWAHKIRNVLPKVRRADHAALKASLHAIMNARTLPLARSAARRFADRWQQRYPKAVACLRADLDELLTCWCCKSIDRRRAVRTTDAIERRFREVRRRTRPMGGEVSQRRQIFLAAIVDL